MDQQLDIFFQTAFTNLKMPLIVIYRNPSDYQGKFVARLWDMQSPTNLVVVKDTLEQIRKAIPPKFVKLERATDDDPNIVEVWL